MPLTHPSTQDEAQGLKHSPPAAETTVVLEMIASYHRESDLGVWVSLFPLAARKLSNFHLNKRTSGPCISLFYFFFFLLGHDTLF